MQISLPDHTVIRYINSFYNYVDKTNSINSIKHFFIYWELNKNKIMLMWRN